MGLRSEFGSEINRIYNELDTLYQERDFYRRRRDAEIMSLKGRLNRLLEVFDAERWDRDKHIDIKALRPLILNVLELTITVSNTNDSMVTRIIKILRRNLIYRQIDALTESWSHSYDQLGYPPYDRVNKDQLHFWIAYFDDALASYPNGSGWRSVATTST